MFDLPQTHVSGFTVVVAFGSVEERGGNVDDSSCADELGDDDVNELGGNVDDGVVFLDLNSSPHLQQQLCVRRL